MIVQSIKSSYLYWLKRGLSFPRKNQAKDLMSNLKFWTLFLSSLRVSTWPLRASKMTASSIHRNNNKRRLDLQDGRPNPQNTIVDKAVATYPNFMCRRSGKPRTKNTTLSVTWTSSLISLSRSHSMFWWWMSCSTSPSTCGLQTFPNLSKQNSQCMWPTTWRMLRERLRCMPEKKELKSWVVPS